MTSAPSFREFVMFKGRHFDWPVILLSGLPSRKPRAARRLELKPDLKSAIASNLFETAL
jgi:hypothetical protein